MFEHFEDLANEKKMNAQTLRAGIEEEFQYALDRAMLPSNRMSQFKGFSSEQSLAKGMNNSPDNKGPKVGDIVDGYEFQGGDPKDQNNWKPVKKGK